MKKILALFLALAMTFALVACGDKASDEGQTNTDLRRTSPPSSTSSRRLAAKVLSSMPTTLTLVCTSSRLGLWASTFLTLASPL